MLEDLLSEKNEAEKKQTLEEKYGMKMTVELEGRLQTMCNLSENIRAEGITLGMSRGLQKGLSQGISQGITQGIAEGKASEIVEMGIDFGLSENAILDRLQKKLNISAQAAQEYLEKFGNHTV